ncbi:MAG: hypothetical protein AB1589_35530 [Cyanobacteriota bacterium]
MNYETLLTSFESSISVASQLIDFLYSDQKKSHEIEHKSEIDTIRIFLYHRIVLISKAAFGLLPNSDKEFFSLTAVGSLTRTLAESYRPFYYLTIEDIEDEERNLRLLIFKAYELIECSNMGEALGGATRKPNIESELANIKQKIEENTFFKKLRKQTQTIYGSIYHSITDNREFSKVLRDKIVEKNGCYKDNETIYTERLIKSNAKSLPNEQKIKQRFKQFFYKFFSNYVHSSAFCIAQEIQSNFKVNDEVGHFLKIIISFEIFCLNIAIEDIFNLFPLAANNSLVQEYKKSMEGMLLFIYHLTGNPD